MKKEISLEELQTKLNAWRRNGRPGVKIPLELRQIAVSLLSKHSQVELIKELGLNSSMLKKWQEETCFSELSEVRSPEFLPLTTTPVIEKCVHQKKFSLTLTSRLKRGQTLKIKGKLALSDWEEVIKRLSEGDLS